MWMLFQSKHSLSEQNACVTRLFEWNYLTKTIQNQQFGPDIYPWISQDFQKNPPTGYIPNRIYTHEPLYGLMLMRMKEVSLQWTFLCKGRDLNVALSKCSSRQLSQTVGPCVDLLWPEHSVESRFRVQTTIMQQYSTGAHSITLCGTYRIHLHEDQGKWSRLFLVHCLGMRQ